MELVYQYLDPDVAEWLKQHAPTPRHGQNYHQWLSAQYGLKKLVERIWMLVGVARTCETMIELRDRMAALNGKQPVQLRFYLPPAIGTNSHALISKRGRQLRRPRGRSNAPDVYGHL